MIYFDSSALIKLIAPEPESAALSEWIRQNSQQPRVTSALSKVDVLRSFREVGAAAEDLASIIVSKIDQMPVKQDVLDTATDLPCEVSPVDAIHLATASKIKDSLHAFVSYDPVIVAAAQEQGLPTASPGAELART